MSAPRHTPAVRVLDDLREKARELARLHERWATTHDVPAELRPEVARAWARRHPDHSPARSQQPHPGDEVRRRRDESVMLSDAVAHLQSLLLDTAIDSMNELVVCDADGVVLWVDGAGSVRRQSEQLGFIEGAQWTESLVGVNALGTALTEQRPIQLFGPEHSNPDQHRWVCSGAPVRDPASTQVIGAITLSGPLASAHPHTLSLVANAVRAVEAELAIRHRSGLRVLANADDAAALVVDAHGWVAAARGVQAGERVWAPQGFAEGPVWLPSLGAFECRRVLGGWALSPSTEQVTTLHLRTMPRPVLEVRQAGATTQVPLSAQHASIVRALAGAGGGLSADQLRDELGLGTTVSARAEVSRLRRVLGGIVESRPYRLTAPCTLD